ncbi:MAG: YqiA/YcfP family alpha/beta fold hydrolase [bacterium]|nr:YqiA/YcfP family alpha/beta fold hydrolase [bacterium]
MINSILYLHGLASSPRSNKANIFRPSFEQHGLMYRVPDLNVPSFEHLTLTAMLERVAEEIRSLPTSDGDAADVALIGSSLGGLTALHFIDRYREIEARRVAKVVLMAPALDFMSNRLRSLGEDGMAEWKRSGWLPTFNYAAGENRNLHYGIVDDVLNYDSYAVVVDRPMLIFHGLHDESVDYRGSVRFAEERPLVTLRLLESDHQLLDQTDLIWHEMVAFLGIGKT